MMEVSQQIDSSHQLMVPTTAAVDNVDQMQSRAHQHQQQQQQQQQQKATDATATTPISANMIATNSPATTTTNGSLTKYHNHNINNTATTTTTQQAADQVATYRQQQLDEIVHDEQNNNSTTNISNINNNNNDDDDLESDIHQCLDKLLRDVCEREISLPERGGQNLVEQQHQADKKNLATTTTLQNSNNNNKLDNDDDQLISKQNVGTTDNVFAVAIAKPIEIISKPNIVMTSDIIETDETKEMVILKNLEITPPPPQISCTPVVGGNSNIEDNNNKTDAVKEEEGVRNEKPATNKRRRAEQRTPDNKEADRSLDEGATGSNKRVRRQTTLFQAGDVRPSASGDSFSSSPDPINSTVRNSKSSRGGRSKKSSTSTTSSRAKILPAAQEIDKQIYDPQFHTNDLQDVIFYEKNDYLAVRNEENSFYLCQLTEDVRVMRPMIRVRWLDTNNEGRTYFLTAQYDKVPQKSIIMPVSLNKLKSEKKGEQLFSLDDQVKDNVIDRLKKAAEQLANSSQESIVT